MSKILIFIGVVIALAVIMGAILSNNYVSDRVIIDNTNSSALQLTKPNKSHNTAGIVNDKILQTAINNSSLVFGPKDAVITIVEFSGFGCGFSKQAFSIIRELQITYPDKIRYIYKHFPLSELFTDKETQKAAEASECAHDQNKFFLMHDKLFQNQENLTLFDIKRYAKEIGLDERQFNTCLDSNKYATRVEKDISTGVELGVVGTPTWFINGQKIEGVIPLDIFKTGIEKVIKNTQQP